MGLNTLSTTNWHWLSGSGLPSPYTGKINDYYLDTATNKVYKKTAYHVWSFVGMWPFSASGTGGNVSLSFTTANWSGDTITVIPTGTPGPGQIGPHNIALGSILYGKVQIQTGSFYEDAFIEIDFDSVTNTLVITKASSYPAFNGAILISYGN